MWIFRTGRPIYKEAEDFLPPTENPVQCKPPRECYFSFYEFPSGLTLPFLLFPDAVKIAGSGNEEEMATELLGVLAYANK